MKRRWSPIVQAKILKYYHKYHQKFSRPFETITIQIFEEHVQACQHFADIQARKMADLVRFAGGGLHNCRNKGGDCMQRLCPGPHPECTLPSPLPAPSPAWYLKCTQFIVLLDQAAGGTQGGPGGPAPEQSSHFADSSETGREWRVSQIWGHGMWKVNFQKL